jgi:hypothetical protein
MLLLLLLLLMRDRVHAEEIREAIGKAGIIEHMAEDTLTSNHEDVQRHSLHLCAILSGQRDLKERCARTHNFTVDLPPTTRLITRLAVARGGSWWLVMAGGWWLVAGGWWLVVSWPPHG